MNPGINFIAFCAECKRERSVSASRSALNKNQPVTVAAIVCDHHWTLNAEEVKKLRKQVADFPS